MLGEHERRRLDEIESRLSAEDPEFAQAMNGTGRSRLARHLRSPSAVLAVISGCAALLCAGLGQAGGFAAAALLTLVLVGATRWKLHPDEERSDPRNDPG
jgi:hypothetical protein